MTIHCDRAAPAVVQVTIANSLRANALNYAMLASLAALWPKLEEDNTVRAVVITGANDCFCSGADLSADLSNVANIDALVDKALLKTAFFSKPLIAAINGACVAGGLELALAADIRIARKEALIGLPEVKWGILASGGGALKLIDQIGYTKALDLLLTGRLITGEEAERIGLVTECVDAKDVLNCALERADIIARNSPIAVKASKRLALLTRAARYASNEGEERRLASIVRKSPDHIEGIQAFLQKRSANYQD